MVRGGRCLGTGRLRLARGTRRPEERVQSTRELRPGCTGRLIAAVLLLLCVFILAAPGRVPASEQDEVTVQVQAEKDTVSLGEAFLFQIRVEGGDAAQGSASPDLSGLKDFSVESLGSQSNNRSSISIINGKMSKVESRGYICSYRLTPKKLGKLVIPSVSVTVGPKSYQTQAIEISVVQPETTEDFRLEVGPSKTRFYVGEPVVVTVTWYLARDVQNASFNLPIFDEAAFAFTDLKEAQDPAKQYYNLAVGQGTVMVEKGRKVLQGREYTTLFFRKVLIAREPGTFKIGESTVSCKALVAYSQNQRRRSPFDGSLDDDFFNFGPRGVYKTFVARSQPLTLTVEPLPQDGKPADFSGCVGRFEIEASAAPTEVNVGDPITLTVSLKGPRYLDNVELPPLARDPDLEKDFRVPQEMAAGVVKDGAKVFTQTLRAKSDQVHAIPPLKLSYFDPETGRYEVARSQAIPIQVKATRMVTAADVEGRTDNRPVKSELEAWSQGIAHNYEGPDVLENQSFRLSSLSKSPWWMAAALLPLSIYLTIFCFMAYRRRQRSDPERLRSRKALAAFKQLMKGLAAAQEDGPEAYARLLDGVRAYLGDKLGAYGAALTFADVRKHLDARAISPQIIARLQEVFSRCEEGRYGGGLGGARPFREVASDALDVVQLLDKCL